jgi:hypothetical protein
MRFAISVLFYALMIGIGLAAPDTEMGLVLSSALGLQLSDLEGAYPALECFEDLCGFGKQATPRRFCPQVGFCDNLSLIIRGGRVVGYIADFSSQDWARSLAIMTRLLGSPKRSVVGPSGLVAIRSEYSTWQILGQLELTYTTTRGSNIYGRLVDSHSISITPPAP